MDFSDNIEVARNLIKENKYNAAYEILINIYNNSTSKEKVISTLELGKLQKLRGKYKDSKYYLKKLKGSFLEPDSFYHLGLLYERDSNYALASSYYEKALVSKYNDSDYLRSLCYRQMGDIEYKKSNKKDAVLYYEKSLDFLYDYNLNLKIASILIEIRSFDKAAYNLNKLLGTALNDEAIIELGCLEEKRQNYKKAEEYYNMLLGTKKENIALYKISKLKILQKDINAAREILKKLLNTNSRSYALTELGKIEKRDKNFNLSMKYFGKLQKEGNNRQANIAILEQGKLYREIKDYKAARMHFQLVLKNPTSQKDREYALNELASLSYERKNNIRCEKYLKQLSETSCKKMAFDQLTYLCIKEDDMEKLFKYINLAWEQGIRVDELSIVYLCMKENIFFKNYQFKEPFFEEKMFINYEEEKIIEKIKQNKSYCNLDDYNIDELFDYIKNNLYDKYKQNIISFYDIYLIPDYTNNGEYIIVYTFPNTKSIIHISSYNKNYKDKEQFGIKTKEKLIKR